MDILDTEDMLDIEDILGTYDIVDIDHILDIDYILDVDNPGKCHPGVSPVLRDSRIPLPGLFSNVLIAKSQVFYVRLGTVRIFCQPMEM